MRRDLSGLAEKEYDLVIVGGGIYGASVARDAALRGLKVALVEQGDFGSGTSANSHKIIHGGLRYLQHGHFSRVRESVRERSILMRIAPHLIFPLPVLVPTYRGFLQGKTVMSIALKLHDLIGYDRNRDLEPHKRIPPGRVISRTECLRQCPGLEQEDLTGAALFFDGQVYNPDRFTLSLLLSAAKNGAVLANYAQVTGFRRERDRITRMYVKDVLSGNAFEVKGRVFVNCSGPWSERVLQVAGIINRGPKKHLVKAVVLVTRQLIPRVAIGVRAKFRYNDKNALIDKGSRYFFITPWRNRSLVGTFEVPYDGDLADFKVTGEELEKLLEQANAAYPAGHITKEDVYFVYGGLLPGGKENGGLNVQLVKHYEIYDHDVEDGLEGLVSVVGVKYTTARHVAEKATNLVEKKLGRRPTIPQTATIPVHGGAMNCFEEFLEMELKKKRVGLSEETIRHLIQTYGSEYREILRYCEKDPRCAQPVVSNSPVIKAEILHGIREEMACKLDDILYRRTELAAGGYPDDSCIRACAKVMADELGYDSRIEQAPQTLIA